jgi:3-oxoacyl-[acyl-carrier protein] reductase
LSAEPSPDEGAQESTTALNAGISSGRYGKPEEFGRVAAFVASPLSGSVITVDGGATRSL